MILVAEDNDVNQIVIEHILMDAGYEYVLVENGKLAVDYCELNRPAVILMDVSMPVMNGVEATQAIRSLEGVTDERVIIIGVSAHAQEFDRQLCLEAGMDDYMSKPVSPDGLARMIGSWLHGTAAANATG